MLFAERYEGSELCCRNALLLAQTQERDLSAPSPEVQAELAIKRETANPMYWGVWTLLRVRPTPQTLSPAVLIAHVCGPMYFNRPRGSKRGCPAHCPFRALHKHSVC